MSEASIGMLTTSIIGGIVTLGIALYALYATSERDRGYAIASGVAVMVTLLICGVCWRFLPHQHDYQKRGYAQQQYRERVWGEYKKCFDQCQQQCHTAAEKTLDYWKEKETR